jgi:hypothetical protein
MSATYSHDLIGWAGSFTRVDVGTGQTSAAPSAAARAAPSAGGQAAPNGSAPAGTANGQAPDSGSAPANQPPPLGKDEKDKLDNSMNAYRAAVQSMADAGIDTGPYQQEARTFESYYVGVARFSDLKDRETYLNAVLKRIDTAADAARADAVKVGKSAVEGTGQAVKDMLDGTKKAIAKVKDKDAVESLTQRMYELGGLDEQQRKEKDRAQRAKLLKQLNTQAEQLYDDAVKAAGDDETKKQAQAVYASALKDRYGIAIDNPDKIANTHLDKVYKMLDKVPQTDVAQGSLKTLAYKATTTVIGPDGKPTEKPWNGASFNKDGGVITMGDINEGFTQPYNDPADPTKVTDTDWFSVTTLHELGHSVDDRFQVMATYQGRESCGGWVAQKIADVAAVYAGDFQAKDGKTVAIDDKSLRQFIESALGTGKGAKPADVSDDDWKALAPQLAALEARCASRRSDASQWPWSAPYDIGGFSYHEAYPNQWWRYVTGKRQGVTVRDYQWRAPGEWFAELYAFTWLNSKPPPGGVDKDVAGYMFGGDKAGGNPQANH